MSKIEKALERAQNKQAEATPETASKERLSLLERATEAAVQHDAAGNTAAGQVQQASFRQPVAPAHSGEGSSSVDGAANRGPGAAPTVPAAPSGAASPSVTAPASPPNPNSSKLAVTQGLYSPASEEYRKLKEQLVKITNQSGFQNMIMVTSSTVGEGKSLTAVNLAVSLAQEFDHTVLLIDADLRRPTCHTYFGQQSGPGLSDCVMEKLPLKDALIATGIGRLSFLPAGRGVPNPGELFNSAVMRDFLLEVKNRYPDRYIIIDTAPVLPFAETRVLSRIVDGTILVVREGAVAIRDVKDSFQALEGTNMLGLVYNGSSKATAPNGYYAYAYAYRR